MPPPKAGKGLLAFEDLVRKTPKPVLSAPLAPTVALC